MRTFRTEGIIIKRRNYGEADRMLAVLTPHHGKLIVVAKGIRRVPSRRSAHVELLNHSVLGLYQGKGYPVLTEAVATETFSALKEDLQMVGFAYHLCELIDGLCPEGQEQFSVYQLFHKTLGELSLGADIVQVIHGFEIELLSLLGYWRGATDVSLRMDTHSFIENILERRLKSRRIFAKMQ